MNSRVENKKEKDDNTPDEEPALIPREKNRRLDLYIVAHLLFPRGSSCGNMIRLESLAVLSHHYIRFKVSANTPKREELHVNDTTCRQTPDASSAHPMCLFDHTPTSSRGGRFPFRFLDASLLFLLLVLFRFFVFGVSDKAMSAPSHVRNSSDGTAKTSLCP